MPEIAADKVREALLALEGTVITDLTIPLPGDLRDIAEPPTPDERRAAMTDPSVELQGVPMSAFVTDVILAYVAGVILGAILLAAIVSNYVLRRRSEKRGSHK